MAHVYNSQLDAYSLYHNQNENSSSSASALNGPALPALGHALAGSTGSAISNLCIYPLDLIITRLQVQRQLRASSSSPSDGEYKGVLDAAVQIYTREGGVSGFYQGVVQDTAKGIADSFLFFLFYNYLRQSRLQRYGPNNKTLPALDELGVGALAGACSKFFTTPIANIVTRKQTASMLSARSSSSGTSNSTSVSDIAAQIRAEKGILGFWSGYSASLVLTMNPSITFFLHESFKRYLLPRSERENPGARVTFLMAAVSKAVASSITYPFSLAKTRAQTAAPSSEPSEKGSTSSKSPSSTVFTTILRIYRTEGPAALYDGVLGEIFRGFFSHGITMIVKDAVHKAIIQLYLLTLRFLKSNSLTASGFKERGGDAYERASLAGYSAAEAARKGGEHGVTAVQSAMGGARARAGDAYERATVLAYDGAVGNAVDAAKLRARDAYERASVVAFLSGEAAGNVVEAVKDRLGDSYERASVLAYKGAVGNAVDAAKLRAGDAYERASVVAFLSGEAAGTVVEAVKDRLGDAYERASVSTYKGAVGNAVDAARVNSRDAYERASVVAFLSGEAAGTVVEAVKERLGDAYERASVLASKSSEVVETVAEGAKNTVADAYERASVMGYNSRETARSAAEQGKGLAGQILEGVQDIVSKNITGSGEGD